MSSSFVDDEFHALCKCKTCSGLHGMSYFSIVFKACSVKNVVVCNIDIYVWLTRCLWLLTDYNIGNVQTVLFFFYYWWPVYKIAINIGLLQVMSIQETPLKRWSNLSNTLNVANTTISPKSGTNICVQVRFECKLRQENEQLVLSRRD